MQKIKRIIYRYWIAGCIALILSGCSLFGLKVQQDYHHAPHTIDPHLNKTAWDFLKQRSIQNNPDTLFKLMYDGIIYSGIDTNEYVKSNRTFILLQNNAIRRMNKTVPYPDCFFGANTPANGKPANDKTTWKDYPKAVVKNYLEYLLLEGEYTHTQTLTSVNIAVETALPKGTFSNNPQSIMNMRIVNSSTSNTIDYPLLLNDSTYVVTSDLLPTNGVIQVVDRYITTIAE